MKLSGPPPESVNQPPGPSEAAPRDTAPASGGQASPPRTIGYRAATATVIASMIGTGVFTTLGFQAETVPHGLALLAVWFFGGVVALCGAVSYAEIAVRLPRSGGEYAYLRAIYHPWLGVMAGLVSIVVGFSAAAALSAMALGHYAASLTAMPPMAIALVALWAVTAVHLVGVRFSAGFQVAATALKLVLIGLFCVAGLTAPARSTLTFMPTPDVLDTVLTAEFGVALLFSAYAYSGWNAAVYMAAEVREPGRALPRALVHGTLLVTAVYLLLNYVFLRLVPFDELRGTVEVGALAASALFGPSGAQLVNGMLCLALISSISALMLAGPRVMEAVGCDYATWAWLARRSLRGTPVRPVLTQCAIATVLIVTGSFRALLSYVGVTLTLFAVLCVAGLFVLRRRAPPGETLPYRAWGYPLTPLIFVLVSTATVLAAVRTEPMATLASISTVLVALVVAALSQRRASDRPSRGSD